jgi:hypothetical protein
MKKLVKKYSMTIAFRAGIDFFFSPAIKDVEQGRFFQLPIHKIIPMIIGLQQIFDIILNIFIYS